MSVIRSIIRFDATVGIQSAVFVPVGRSRGARVSSCVFTVLGAWAHCCFGFRIRLLHSVLDAGKQGLCLVTPCLLNSENHEEIERILVAILTERQHAFGEAGCPSAVVSDKVTRDSAWLTAFLTRLFPVAMSREETRTAICQDIIHRVWAFTRVLPKHHPDCSMAGKDIKAIFGRFTWVGVGCAAMDGVLILYCVVMRATM